MAPPVLPLVRFAKNESRLSKSLNGGAFTVKRVHDYYCCSCPEWNAAVGAIDGKTCKHLKDMLGEKYELWRVGRKVRVSAQKSSGSGTKRKATSDPEEEDDDEDDDAEESSFVDEDDEEEEEEEEVPTESEASDDQDGKKKCTVIIATKQRKSNSRAKRVKVSSDEEEDEDGDNSSNGAKQKTSKAGRPIRAAPPPANLHNHANFKPLLAERWDLDNGIDVAGWYCSEKLDGVRAYWNGTHFQSREGNKFYAPDWFTKRLPKDVTLDGELFTERGGFQECVSIVKSQKNTDRWKFKVTFQVFDCPSKANLPFERRIAFLKDLLEVKLKIKWINVVTHQLIKDKDHVLELLDDVLKAGGEGLMLREPSSKYVNGRSKTLLKVKKFYDADAIVRGYEQGSGKNSNVVGALKCEMLDPNTGKPTGQMFKVGSGLTDAQRRKPPKIGAIIIYKYQELSKSGNPRFPTFGGERAD